MIVVKEPRARLSREEWLVRALDVVATKGNTKLRIYELVKQIGVSTGSFYWHFKDRDDFVRALVDYYHRWSTDHVIEEVRRIGGDAGQHLRTVMRFVVEGDFGRYEIAMSSWGVQEPIVEDSFREAIGRRIEFVRSLFSELGFKGQELEARTLAFVGYMRMVHEADDPEMKSEHLRHLEERHGFFTRS